MINYVLVPSVDYAAEISVVGNVRYLLGIESDYYKQLLGLARSSTNCGGLYKFESTGLDSQLNIKCVELWLQRAAGNSESFLDECFMSK